MQKQDNQRRALIKLQPIVIGSAPENFQGNTSTHKCYGIEIIDRLEN